LAVAKLRNKGDDPIDEAAGGFAKLTGTIKVQPVL
jgi:hypothetical protein